MDRSVLDWRFHCAQERSYRVDLLEEQQVVRWNRYCAYVKPLERREVVGSWKYRKIGMCYRLQALMVKC